MKLTILSNNYKKENLDSKILNSVKDIHSKIYSSNDKFGKTWVEYPNSYNKEEFERMIFVANKIKKEDSYLLVIGIGGSYLGAKAGIDMLAKDSNRVIFCGINLDYEDLGSKLEFLKDKNVYVNVISKSGTTVEILSTYNIVKEFMVEKYQDKYTERIIFTTDLNKGYLRELSRKQKIETFCVPDDMGGRYSVLSAVGMFPFAFAGIDINKIMSGAKKAYDDLKGLDNDSINYALYRYYQYQLNNKQLEIVTTFDYKLGFIPYWIQQLFCESEGKEGKALFVSPLLFTRDLHSVGQFIQQGNQCFVETFIKVNNKNIDKKLVNIKEDSPIKYLEGKSMNILNDAAFNGTIKAHRDANVDIAIFDVDNISEYEFGYMVYFFELACAYSAYLLEVNPFDQPGVEQYKSYMKENLK